MATTPSSTLPAACAVTAATRALTFLDAYIPGGALEARWRAEALEALGSARQDADVAASLLGRGAGLHLTASAMVVDGSGQHALLLDHPKVGRWLQPGGHTDGDGDLLAVAVREVAEEMGLRGLDADPVPVDLAKHTTACGVPGWHFDVRFLLRLPQPVDRPSLPVPVSPEGLALAWFPLTDLTRLGPRDGVGKLAAATRKRLMRP